jgi:membrane protease YdiL (CAAX protease family)
MDRGLPKKQTILYFCFAYAIAWLFFLPLGLSLTGLGWIPLHLSLPIMTVLGTTAPTLSALLTLRITEHRWPHIRRIANLRRWLFTLLLCPFLIGFTYAVLPAIWLAKAPASSLHWSALLSLSFYNYSTFIGGPLGEESGWRGFALPRLQNLLGPSKASLLLGILWAGWHLPLFLCKSWSSSSAANYVLIVITLSFVITFLFNLSGGSLIVAILAHASFNTVSRWLGTLLGSLPLIAFPSPELAIGLAGLGMAALLVLLSRGNLALENASIAKNSH